MMHPLLTFLPCLLLCCPPVALAQTAGKPVLVPRPLPKPSGNYRPAANPVRPQPRLASPAGPAASPSTITAPAASTGSASSAKAVILDIRRAASSAPRPSAAQPTASPAIAPGAGNPPIVRDGEVRILRSGLRLAEPKTP